MADDRKRGYERHARPRTAVPEEFDPDKTPVPETPDEVREWRRIDERVGKTELVQHAYTQSFARVEALIDEFLSPSVKKLMSQLDTLITRQASIDQRLETFFDEQWPLLTKAVDELCKRLERVEKKQDEFHTALAAHHDRIAKAEKALDDLDKRLEAEIEARQKLERRLDDKALVTTAEKAQVRRWLNAANAVKAAVAIAIAAAGYLAGSHL